MQRVASRGSLVTPVATPVEKALDDEPAASDSKEVGDRTDSITRDGVDESAHDEASLITLLAGLGIQLPASNSPKAKGLDDGAEIRGVLELGNEDAHGSNHGLDEWLRH